MLASLIALIPAVAFHIQASHALPSGVSVPPLAVAKNVSTLPSHAARDETNVAQRAQTSDLLLCSETPCGSGVCKTFNLLEAEPNTCYDAGMIFASAAIQDVGFLMAPVKVVVGLSCDLLTTSISNANQCFETEHFSEFWAIQ